MMIHMSARVEWFSKVVNVCGENNILEQYFVIEGVENNLTVKNFAY